MGDFKCNSGISSENKDRKNSDLNNNLNDDYASVNSNIGSETDSMPNSYGSGESNNLKNDSYQKTGSAPYDSEDYSSSDCGCGASKDSSRSDFTDDLQYPDDAQAATIYSETIIFAEPYDSVDNDPATSDLIEDEQEGSEFTSSNPSRPQC